MHVIIICIYVRLRVLVCVFVCLLCSMCILTRIDIGLHANRDCSVAGGGIEYLLHLMLNEFAMDAKALAAAANVGMIRLSNISNSWRKFCWPRCQLM